MWVIEVRRSFKDSPDQWGKCSGSPGTFEHIGPALAEAGYYQVRDYLSEFRLRHVESGDTFSVLHLFKLEIQRKVKRVYTQPLLLDRSE